MVVRGSSSTIAIAVGAAAAAAAAQLGVAYGTGVVSWPTELGPETEQAWASSLTWAAWISASSTVAGAVVAARLRGGGPGGGGPGDAAHSVHGHAGQALENPAHDQGEERAGGDDRLARVLWRLVMVLAAAVGAVITVALVAVPARDAVAAVADSPQTVAAGYAVIGVGLGLLLAIAALTARAIAANLVATAVWLWLLAVVVVVEGVVSGRDWARVPLGFVDLDTGDVWFRSVLLPDAAVALAAALVIGALAALPAVRRGDPPIGVVVSGATGPLLVAAVYLLAQPDLASAAAIDMSRHLAVPYLVLAGLAGSLLISAVPARGPEEPEPEDEPEEDMPGEGTAAVQVPAARIAGDTDQ